MVLALQPGPERSWRRSAVSRRASTSCPATSMILATPFSSFTQPAGHDGWTQLTVMSMGEPTVSVSPRHMTRLEVRLPRMTATLEYLEQGTPRTLSLSGTTVTLTVDRLPPAEVHTLHVVGTAEGGALEGAATEALKASLAGSLLLASLFPAARSPEARGLTPTEFDIVEHILQGWTNKQIAESRGTAPTTVANQIAAIYQKLGLCSRADLMVRLALSDPASASTSSRLASLSAREQQVVLQASQGHSNKRIAIELGLTESTVATHLRRALGKLGLRSRRELILDFQAAVTTPDVS
jgi:DNA-binding NarL/FixJ family response regulator